jgi:hypothetical protein
MWPAEALATRPERRGRHGHLELTLRATTRATPGRRPATLAAARLIATVIAPRPAAGRTILEAPVAHLFFTLVEPLQRFPARTHATARGCLNHDHRRVVLVWNLGGREPALLQERKLVKQRFLQRSSHTLSLRLVLVQRSWILRGLMPALESWGMVRHELRMRLAAKFVRETSVEHGKWAGSGTTDP